MNGEYRTLLSALAGAAARGGAIAVLAVSLGGCFARTDPNAGVRIPSDYRLRHPIVVQEGEQKVELFVGANRGGLLPAQRADVLAFARRWEREGTGGILIDVPAGAPNERAANDALREVQSILGGAGVPPNGVALRSYHPANAKVATLRLTYPKFKAHAGPCGVWPADLGPSIDNPEYFDNRPYWNFGCATQRNLAAMVENPADLVQPRGETPVYTARRTTVIDKYRKGESTATVYPNETKGTISDVGK
jgi:pilus assembly protein CpaD